MNFNFKTKIFVSIFYLMTETVDNIFIDTNFDKFLKEVCHTHSNVLLFSKGQHVSLMEQKFLDDHCHFHNQDLNSLNEDFTSDIIQLDENDVNLIVELNSESELHIIYKVIDSKFSMNVNFIIIIKSGTLEDIELKIFHKFDGFRCHIVKYVNGLSDVNVSYVRPVINGCHSFNGILYSSEANLKEKMTSTACNLNGTYLRVAANIVSEVISKLNLNFEHLFNEWLSNE